MSWKPLLSLSLGAAALLPATTAAAEDFVLDLPELTISLGEVRNETDKGIDNKYVVRAKGIVIGPNKRPDRVVMDWKAGGKTLATIDCESMGGDGYQKFSCEQPQDQALDTYGDVQAVLSYVDDSEDQTHVMHTMNLKVGRFWNWYQRGKKTLHYPKYQIIPADLLGSAIAWHEEDRPGTGQVKLYTWSATAAGKEIEGDSMRCSVDGKKVIDFSASAGGTLVAQTIDWRGPDKEKHEVEWRSLNIGTRLMWGAKDKVDPGYQRALDAGEMVLLDDHPGAWSCDWRAKGKVIRNFSFAVAGGRIQPHAEQSAGLTLPKSEAMIDVSFPEDAPDAYFDPAAIKKGGFYGRTWSSPDATKKMKLGKAKGPIELPAPKGAKGGKPAKPAK